MKKKFLTGLVAGMIILCVNNISNAAPSLITNGNDSSLNGSTVIDFNAEVLGGFISRSFGGGAVTFSSVTNNLGIENIFMNNYGTTGKYLANGLYNGDPVKISFTNPVTAFGFSWGAADQPWTMSLYNSSNSLLGTLSIPAQSSPYAGFIGGTDPSSSISYAVMNSNSNYGYDYFLLDDFEYVASNHSTVPEPGTLILLGTGLAGLAGIGIRRKKMLQ